VGARFSALVQTGPWAHPASCTMGTEYFPGVKSGRGVTLTPHPFLVPWSWKGTAIPLLPLWAVQPVQSLSACTRVHFTCFYLHSRQHRLSTFLRKSRRKAANYLEIFVQVYKVFWVLIDGLLIRPSPTKRNHPKQTGISQRPVCLTFTPNPSTYQP
jgi:hypothetical protein